MLFKLVIAFREEVGSAVKFIVFIILVEEILALVYFCWIALELRNSLLPSGSPP